ncbi:zinc-binding dehydrogenase [Sphaerimonospora cavernae]|uniref:Zinc-binding dehydrogenase n=1 Tax=Sphaerimonospora cavernae TaxID=1740611 RepID=A0ABV6UCJ3_9ACTN
MGDYTTRAPSAAAPATAEQTWPSGTMRAAAILSPHRTGVLVLPIPEPAAEEVLVAPVLVGLCGTDVELLHGTASYVRDGRALYPHVFGHEWTGVVTALFEGTDRTPQSPRLAVGDRVVGQTMIPCGSCRACRRGRRNECGRLREVGLYGQQGAAAEYIRMSARSLTIVPDGVPDMAALLTEPAVTVLAAFERARCLPGDRVLVLGTGTIGLLAVQLAAALAGTVDVIGVDDSGLEAARRFGADRVFRPGQAKADHYDFVVEASGAIEAFHEALRVVGVGGSIAAIGVPTRDADGVPLSDLVLRGITVHGIRHGLDLYDRVLDLFRHGVLTADGMVARSFPMEDVSAAFDLLLASDRTAPKVALDLRSA